MCAGTTRTPANSDIEYLAMMTDIEMEQEEDEQEVQDHGEEE